MTVALGHGVKVAQAHGLPLVALESALITHGFAYPANLAITRRIIGAVRERGAEPAVAGVWQGVPHVGLTEEQMEVLAVSGSAVKVSVRDLAWTGLRGVHGGTTVAATALLAHRAGIAVFATGGIGGVHRGHPEDVSADLPVLASTPIVVVCAGAKSILDLPRTLEYLETSGVPVVGWQTDEFPAFYSRSSGLPVDVRVDSPEEVAHLFRNQRALGLPQAVLVAVPVPVSDELPPAEVEPLIEQAIAEAADAGVVGKALTPFILARLVTLSEDRTRRANESLLVQNAAVAAEVARCLAYAPKDA
jgi:pseudouridylate synthase